MLSSIHFIRIYSLTLLQPASAVFVLNISASTPVNQRRITEVFIEVGSDCLCLGDIDLSLLCGFIHSVSGVFFKNLSILFFASSRPSSTLIDGLRTTLHGSFSTMSIPFTNLTP